ncbi:MAG: carbohydrate binding family 9 domain-containing protein, partial [Candidatus Aminicenantes bacterium]|nr:carbohydrate binding family 9 domain-containing protein [Candidatus Aminicenantes bacterium]
MKFKAILSVMILAVLLAFAPPAAGRAQDQPAKYPPPQSLTLTPAASPIRIDGRLDEPAWERAGKLDRFYEWQPGDNSEPPVKTECLVTYDESRIYIAFRCFDPEPALIRAHLMDRDATDTLIQDDHVLFMLDTFNDERRGFQFRVNPLGVQADAAFSELEGFEDFSWDAIWESAGSIADFGYAVEVAVPFNQLRFPKTSGRQTWGFEAGRSYPRNVRHRMSSHVRDRDRNCLLCQFNKITGFEGITPGRNMQFTPTLTVDRSDARRDFPSGPMEAGPTGADAGLTARWGITPNLMLNATLNPDFSQIEADVAQLDVNTRFALFYPEKRPFFLEGADFFMTPIQAVFTRTVADPLWGTKVTGKVGRSAVGFFAARDRINNLLFPSNQGSGAASLDNEVMSGVFRYRYDLGRGSTLGALYAGRDGDGYRNHAGGVDGFLRLGESDMVIFQFLRSDTRYPFSLAVQQGQSTDAFAGNALLAQYVHQTRNWLVAASYQDLDPGFRADSGFLPRVDTRQVDLETHLFFYGKRGGGRRGEWFDQLQFWVRAYRVEDHSGRLTDSRVALGGLYQGPWQSVLQLVGRWNQEYYAGTLYDTSDVVLAAMLKPGSGVSFGLEGQLAKAIDYANTRDAVALRVGPTAEFGLGRHVNFNASYWLERLSRDEGRIYTANLLQGRLIYN